MTLKTSILAALFPLAEAAKASDASRRANAARFRQAQELHAQERHAEARDMLQELHGHGSDQVFIFVQLDGGQSDETVIGTPMTFATFSE